MGCFDTNVDTLSPEELRQISGNSLQTLIDYTPELVELDRKITPQMVGNELSRTQRLLEGTPTADGLQDGLLDIGDRASERINAQNVASNRAIREGDLADVEANAGRVRSAIEGENQALFSAIDAQSGGDPLQDTLTRQAQTDLFYRDHIDSQIGKEVHQLRDLRQTAFGDVARGGRLSDEQLRDVQQQSRAGDSARGILRSGTSVGNEILNTERARRENLAFADSRLAGLGEQLNSVRGRQIALREHLTDNARQTSNTNFSRGQQNINNRLSTFIDPFQGVLGRQAVNQSTTGGFFGQSNFNNQNSTRPNFMNDFNAMNSAIAGMTMDGRIGQANANAGVLGGLFGGIGSAIGGIFGG